MTPARRRAAPLLLTLLLTTGCLMTSSSDPDTRGPLVAEDVVRLDLREPPTREEAGFAEGRNSLLIERVGDAIDVEVVLPGDRTLKTEAYLVRLFGPLDQQVGDKAVMIGINRRLPDIAAVREALLEEAEALALDPADIEAFTDRVGESPSASLSQVLTGTAPEPPETVVEAQYSEDTEDWVLAYSFRFPDDA